MSPLRVGVVMESVFAVGSELEVQQLIVCSVEHGAHIFVCVLFRLTAMLNI